ncbi:LutC/YkgG family protein [Arenibaculum pallidiluteum]|uniref:LutC/YkgG family protein n=1 Tax=Arenibaculum pallidiluteum TaxID=2812559 RepID=UPI001A974B0F|nr:LUD domain-containing protein [Arenibaculum pallidiluteum]
MTSARDQILAGIRRSLRRDAPAPSDAQACAERIERHPRNLIPARAQLPHPEQVELFVSMLGEVAATVQRLPGLEAVPDAVADYLASQNLPAELRMAPDPDLEGIPWERRPTLTITTGRAEDRDPTSLTGAAAGVAETGTLVMTSGAEHPTTLNLMPDTHIVVLRADRIVGTYEDAWDVLRARGPVPRTVNFITGPSRTGDIEQTIQLGAHGPRRLHVLLVEQAGA